MYTEERLESRRGYRKDTVEYESRLKRSFTVGEETVKGLDNRRVDRREA